MMALAYDIKGTAGEKITLPREIFEVKVSPALLAQAVRSYLSNQRKASAKTKTRGDVQKTTAKMYKQKGTGRARHGSYAAPIFVGGGVAHGPAGNQNYKKVMPKKIARQAFLGALSNKAAQKDVWVLTGADKSNGKTADGSMMLEKMGLGESKTLIVASGEQKVFLRAFRNIS